MPPAQEPSTADVGTQTGRERAGSGSVPAPPARHPLPSGEAGFRALAAALPQMIWVSGPTGGVEYISPRWVEFTGADEAVLLGTGFQDFIHPDDRAEIVRRRSDPERGDEASPPPVEFRLLRHDGEYRMVEARVEYLRGDDGEIAWVVGSAVDVTDDREARVLVRDQVEQLRAAVSATGVARYVYYPEAQQIIGDARLSEIVGISAEDLMTHDGLEGFIAMIHPDDAPNVEAGIASAFAGGPDYDETYRIKRPDGAGGFDERWVAARGHAEFDSGGPTRMVGIVEDVTERVHEEETRLQTQKREAIGTLASGIAHDFNNVLSAIMSNANLAAAEARAGASPHESIQEITLAAKRAADMVRRLLSASREEEPVAVAFDLGAVVEEACALVSSTLPRSVRFARLVPWGLPPVIGDATQVHQITMNLVTNAGYAVGDEGSISVSVEQLNRPVTAPGDTLPSGPYLAIRVTDDGEGMSPAVLSRAFDPFFTTKPSGEGTGLGLTASQRIARNHGGDIRIRSEVGAGTTVTVYLPAAIGQQVAGPADAGDTTEAAAPKRGTRVLFVDDEDALVRLARRALPMAGFEVVAFDRPTEALESFRADPRSIDVLLTDLSMPGLTGLELIAAVREVRADVAVVLSSGYLDAENHAMGEELGIDAIVPKPCSIDDLSGAIRRVVEARR